MFSSPHFAYLQNEIDGDRSEGCERDVIDVLRRHNLELVDEAKVSGVHVSHIVDTPAQKCEAIESHAKCEALIFFSIQAGILEDLWMHHASAHHFYPFVSQFL